MHMGTLPILAAKYLSRYSDRIYYERTTIMDSSEENSVCWDFNSN